jgi:hypothetical protein
LSTNLSRPAESCQLGVIKNVLAIGGQGDSGCSCLSTTIMGRQEKVTDCQQKKVFTTFFLIFYHYAALFDNFQELYIITLRVLFLLLMCLCYARLGYKNKVHRLLGDVD